MGVQPRPEQELADKQAGPNNPNVPKRRAAVQKDTRLKDLE